LFRAARVIRIMSVCMCMCMCVYVCVCVCMCVCVPRFLVKQGMDGLAGAWFWGRPGWLACVRVKRQLGGTNGGRIQTRDAVR